MLAMAACPRMVIHHFDAEWEMAQFCAAAFPSAKTREILAGMAKERRQSPNPTNEQK
jgi:hypothetical protein